MNTAYVTSDDVGPMPFNPDKNRGRWSSPLDFLFACVGCAFKHDIMFVSSMLFADVGFVMLIPYVSMVTLCMLPIILIQSYLGQFSSTGFISAFRVAPLFKGIGYVSLTVNLLVLTFYSIFAAIPVFYFFYSLRPVLPWSCEGSTRWMNQTNLVLIGRVIRYSMVAVVAITTVFVVRLGFLPGALSKFHCINRHKSLLERLDYHTALPFLGLGGLGPGWGSILSMASYNTFRTDITKYSWLVCVGQMGLVVLTSFVWLFIRNFWKSMESDYLYWHSAQTHWMEFVTVPSALATMEMPHFWSLLFFGMMAAGATNLMIVQLLSVLTSLFDEFEVLRSYRLAVVTLTAAVLCMCSMVFCSNLGLQSIEFLSRCTIFTQILLNLMLLLVVLWVYGLERLQRDFYFMTGRKFHTGMECVAMLVTPIMLLLSALYGLFTLNSTWHTPVLYRVTCIVVIYPWLIIPGYCFFKVSQVTGNIVSRFKRCLHPTDWWPARPEDRQLYKDTFRMTDVSHGLTIRDEV